MLLSSNVPRLLTVAGAAFAVVVGAAIGTGAAQPWMLPAFVAAAVAVSLVVLLAPRFGLGAAIALLAGASADALPGPSVGGLTNVAMFVLVGLLFYAGRRNLGLVPTTLYLLCGALLVCWFVNVGRAITLGAPLRPTLRFGEDFAVLALIIPGYTATLYDKALRKQVIIGTAALAVWVGFVNVAASLHLLPGTGLFAHAYRVVPIGSIDRLYALSSELATDVIPFALGAALFAPEPRWRRGGLVVLLAGSLEALLSLGRVKYAGLVVMAAVMLILWGRGKALGRALTLCAAVIVVGIAATATGPLHKPAADLAKRATTIFASSEQRQAYEGADTLLYRNVYKANIRSTMDTSDWLFGHGLLPDPWYYFPPDPGHSLRDSDFGWYEGLNTVGLVGTFLIFAPLFYAMLLGWKARRTAPGVRWLAFGGMGFGVYTVFVSQTLGVLFSPTGVVFGGFAIALGVIPGMLRNESERATLKPSRGSRPKPHTDSAAPNAIQTTALASGRGR